jgi:hypothetical protein
MNILKRFKVFIIGFLVLFSVTCLLSVKYREFGRRFLNNITYKHGDLFEMSKLWRFKDDITFREESFNNPIQEADIITMGDSFMQSDFDTPTISYQLEELTGKKVHYVKREDFASVDDNPLAYLDKINYKKGKAKYLVLETVERYALDRSSKYQYTTYKDHVKYTAKPAEAEIAKAKEATADIKNFIEPSNLQYFFYNNKVIYPFYEIGKNFRFEMYEEIDKRTPVYSENPDMLFFYEDIDFGSSPVDRKSTDMMAFNVHLLRNILKEKYDLELIYVLMPTKYSVYGQYCDDFKGYNNFITFASEELERLKVNSFDLYSIYNSVENIDKDLLYYKGDTHFTPRGKSIVIDNILKFIEY